MKMRTQRKTIYTANPQKERQLVEKETRRGSKLPTNIEAYRPATASSPSNYPGDKLEHTGIRSDAVREGLTLREGNLCITIVPGDEVIGDIQICIQYEGKKDTGIGEPDLCVKRQNDMLLHVSDWLVNFFKDKMAESSEWDVDLSGHSSPKANVPLMLEAASQILEREVTLQQGLHESEEILQNQTRSNQLNQSSEPH